MGNSESKVDLRKRLCQQKLLEIFQQKDVIDKDHFIADKLKEDQLETMNYFWEHDKCDLFGYLVLDNNPEYFQYIYGLIDIANYRQNRHGQSKLLYKQYEFACEHKMYAIAKQMLLNDYYWYHYSKRPVELVELFRTTYKYGLNECCKIIIDKYTSIEDHEENGEREYIPHFYKLLDCICVLPNEEIVYHFITKCHKFQYVIEKRKIEQLLCSAIEHKFTTVIDYIFKNISQKYIFNDGIKIVHIFDLIKMGYFHQYWTQCNNDHQRYSEQNLIRIFDYVYTNGMTQYMSTIIDIDQKYPTRYNLFAHNICFVDNEDILLQFISYDNNFSAYITSGHIELLLTNALKHQMHTVLHYIVNKLPCDYVIKMKCFTGKLLFDLVNYNCDLFTVYWKYVLANNKTRDGEIYMAICEFLKLLCTTECISHINLVFDTMSLREADNLDLYTDYSSDNVRQIFIERYDLNNIAFLIKKYGSQILTKFETV